MLELRNLSDDELIRIIFEGGGDVDEEPPWSTDD